VRELGVRLVAPRGIFYELLEEGREDLDEARVGLRRGRRRRRAHDEISQDYPGLSAKAIYSLNTSV